MIVIIIIALLFMYPPLIEDDGISDHPIWSIVYSIPLFYIGPFLLIILGYQRDSLFYKIVGFIFLTIHALMIIFGKELPISIVTRKILSFLAATLMLVTRFSFIGLFIYAGYLLVLWIPQNSYSLSEYCKDNIVIKPIIDTIQEKFHNFVGAIQDTKESLGVSYGITVSQDTINLDMVEHPSEQITVSVNNTHKDFSLNWTNSQKIRVEEVENKNGELTFNITARWEGDCELTFTLVDQNNDNKIYDTEVVNVHVTNSAPDRLFEYNSHLYSCYDISMSWTEAEAYCRELGGHLASINDENEQELIMAMSASYCNKQNIWIGGYYENDSWKWTDGSSFSYQNWDADKPDNYEDNEFFLRYANDNVDYETWSAKQGKWDDCAENGSGDDSDAPLSSFGFVCEWDSRGAYNATRGSSLLKWDFQNSLTEASGAYSVVNGDVSIIEIPDESISCAAYFDGDGDYIDCGEGINLTKDFALVTYLRCDDVDKKYSAFFAKYEENKKGAYAFAINRGRINVWITTDDNGNHIEFESSSSLINGQWYHVAIVKHDLEVSLYVDGVKEASKELSGYLENDDTVTIGRQALMFSPEDQLQFTGAIAYINIYNTELTDDTIYSMYSSIVSSYPVKISETAVELYGHYYQLYSDVAGSWEEAEKYCEKLGGHLAVINNSEENNFLYSYMIGCGYNSAYFGLVDRNCDNTWSWTDGSEVGFTNWADGEPNSTSEPYGMFYYKFTDGTWNDGRWGDDTTAFICEWDAT